MLLGASVLGLAIAPFSCYNWSFGILGGLVFLMFGIWLAFYHYLSLQSPGEQRVANIKRMKSDARAETNRCYQAERKLAEENRNIAAEARKARRQELEMKNRVAATKYKEEFDKELAGRRRTLKDTEQTLKALEEKWWKRVEMHRLDRGKIAEKIRVLVSECRSLGSNYQGEQQQLTSRSEVTARVRHMRLHLIADADIPLIGAGRQQVLASHGIFTAADIELCRIHGIRGFGEVLTSNLMAWKEEVFRQFRFDPATAVSPAERSSITAKFQQRQNQIFAELARQKDNLETLLKACQKSLSNLDPDLRRAVALYEQAEAGLLLLDGKR